MGCLKLTYREELPQLKVVKRDFSVNKNSCAGSYRYGFGGYEKDDEIKGSGNHYSLSDYGYDPRLGRRWRPDAHGGRYPFISPYAYALDNPISVVDPDGKDVYLVVWATSDGKIGHAGLAVDNYKKIVSISIRHGEEVVSIDYVKDGTVTYYDLWPGGDGAGKDNAGKDVPAKYNTTITTLEELENLDITGSEGYPADGIVKLRTSSSIDEQTKAAIEQFKQDNPNYNGRECNCSDLAEEGVEVATGKNVKANEFILTKSSTTPNKLFRKTAKLPNAEVVKDPGGKVKKSFIRGVLEKPAAERKKQ